MAVRTDQHHVAATSCYRELLAQSALLVTSDYVLDETITRIRYDVSHRHAVQFLDLVEAAQDLQYLQVLYVDENTFKTAQVLFKRYADQALSLTDCTSFALCQREEIQTAFAFDHHFGIFGLAILPAQT